MLIGAYFCLTYNNIINLALKNYQAIFALLLGKLN